MSEETSFNKTQNTEDRLTCAKCLRVTRHKVLQSVDIEGEDLGWDVSYTNNYQIVQCQGCDAISFCKRHSDSDDVEWDHELEDAVPNVTVQLYPSRLAGRQKLRRAHSLPREVSRIYDETHAALCSKQPILAGIGIRALVETVCTEKAATGFNLEAKIDNLVAKGVLTSTGAETLHSMRILGNEAAHEVKPHSEETLGLAMDVVEHLLNDVYVLPALTSKLPKRTKAGVPEV
jgi:hypothetical protein